MRTCTLAVLALALGAHAFVSQRDMHARQLAAAAARIDARGAKHAHKHKADPGAGVKNITFTNPKASEFWVDGAAIPEVKFDIGPSWAGLLPISNKTGETRQLFFWFFPPGPEGSLDDLIFWTNGGPGCSSLEGVLQENGPFSWAWGQAAPTVNEYSWTNISSMLYVEQPVGTGFSQGTPDITNEDELAAQLVGFFQQFLEVFTELKGKKLWLSGESYAGQYVPYIANYIYENPSALDLSLQGIWISDPVIAYDFLQTQVPALAFVKSYANVFNFPNATMAALQNVSDTCNYTHYAETYGTYPPKGPLPLLGENAGTPKGCDLYNKIFDAALEINPAFNLYRIFDVYPVLWDVLGFPGSFPQTQSPIYFNRTDVKKAIHAPLNVSWTECSNEDVFLHRNDDTSLPSGLSVLPNVIEKSVRTVVVNGLADYCILAGGTRLAIQNMTWGGVQGFQTPINESNFVVKGFGPAAGNTHAERGLTYVEVVLSGHMVPQFSPWSALQIMKYLVGQRESVSD